MNKPKTLLWQKWSSYLFPVVIEKTAGEYNPYLEVILSRGRYQLNSPSATYSYEDLYTSYKTALSAIEILNNMQVLVLGLGLGSIPFILQKKFGIFNTIDCVEIDKKIIELCKKYYPDDRGMKNIKIFKADAFDFIAGNTKKYDLITMDVFIDRDVPQKLHTVQFLSALRNTAAYNGIILLSRLKSNNQKEKLLWNSIDEVFPWHTEIETMGNSIMYWKNS